DLQLFRGVADELLAYLLDGVPHGLTHGRGRTAGARGQVVRRDVGIGPDHLEVVVRDTQCFGGDLGQCGVRALAHFHGGGEDLDAAVDVDLHRRVRGRRRDRGLDDHRASPAALDVVMRGRRGVGVEQAQRVVEYLTKVHVVQGLAGGEAVTFAQQVPAP